MDVSDLELGESVHVGDIAEKYKFEFLKDDYEKILASCSHPKVQKIEDQ